MSHTLNRGISASVPLARHRLENQINVEELSRSKLKGRVMASFWRKDFNKDEIQHVLEQLKSRRKISEDGVVNLQGFETLDRYKAILVSAVGFDVRTDALKSRIVQDTLFSSDLSVDFTEDDFRSVAWKLSSKHQDDLVPYKVVFPLWNIPPFLAGVKKRGDVTINFSPSKQTNLFKKIARTRGEQRSQFKEFFTEKRIADLHECSMCIAHVAANSPADAYERASEVLYEILGLINIARDGGKQWRWSSSTGGHLPVSVVLIGPHMTTHNQDGSLAHHWFWIEKWKDGPNKRQHDRKVLAAWEKNYTDLVQGVVKSPWSEHCRSAAARYFKAFSNPNLEESFLGGWRLFEDISGPRQDCIEKKRIRVSKVFRDSPEHRIIGKHLALRRNLITHGRPIDIGDEETLAFQMLQFVHPYLCRFIWNPFSFATKDEFWEFLDLPVSQSDREDEAQSLQWRLSLLDKAKQFRKDDA